ncbi:RNA-binding protein [Caldisalinibacter kiritimatiensis]|uniref:RNA-binding S4 domain-containing protein n=1 Tax=Caldisalinibacter kiritimatiensis TaxID=1304284 RepID=R1CXD5_9FIRM|nr:YlmH/Sll1252 family protein [Caldisalinibacter kiritimatiensis]EOD01289.1 hypothetical protein L21TH_0643 [Caldisalinibacter kiritimatiensis]
MLLDKEKYLEHIKDNEQIFEMRKVLDKVEQVMSYHSIEYTDFLNPYQCRLARSFLNRFHDIEYYEDGGYNSAERKTIIIYPFYLDRMSVEAPLAAVKIENKSKFNNINHRDYLGAIMSLGIKREKIGDIVIHDNYTQVVLHKDILEYVILNLNKIGNEPVRVNEISINDVIKGKEEYKEIFSTVASLRLDSLVSSAVNVSRKISQNYIKLGKVKVNWQPIQQLSYEVKEGDVFSIRGYGRYKLESILGNSKKDRLKLIIRKYI